MEFLRKIKDLWMAFSNILMKINTRILLSLLYFILIGPISLLMKAFGQDMLEKKLDPSAESYLKHREKNNFDLPRYKRQF